MRIKRTFPYLLSAVLIILILLYLVQALQGAKNGLSAFAQSVLPALFPFFVATSLFTKLGAATVLSKRLQPLMRPLLACPGKAPCRSFCRLSAAIQMEPAPPLCSRQSNLRRSRPGAPWPLPPPLAPLSSFPSLPLRCLVSLAWHGCCFCRIFWPLF